MSLLPLCHCQFTMCLTMQTHYYKPRSYKNSRNSFMTFLLTKDSHSVVHCCHRSCCSSHCHHRSSVDQRYHTDTKMLWMFPGHSSVIDGLSPKQHVQFLNSALFHSHCHVQNSAVVLHVQPHLWFFIHQPFFLGSTERYADSGKQYQKRQGLVAFFFLLGKLIWKIQEEAAEPPVNIHTRSTLHLLALYEVQLLLVNVCPTCEIWRHITDLRLIRQIR